MFLHHHIKFLLACCFEIPLQRYFKAVLSHSVISDSLRPRGLYPTRLLCPWGFSMQEYWSGLPFPSPGDLPNPGIEPRFPTLQGILYHLSHQESPFQRVYKASNIKRTQNKISSPSVILDTREGCRLSWGRSADQLTSSCTQCFMVKELFACPLLRWGVE